MCCGLARTTPKVRRERGGRRPATAGPPLAGLRGGPRGNGGPAQPIAPRYAGARGGWVRRPVPAPDSPPTPICVNLEVLFLLSPLYQRGARGDLCAQLFGDCPIDSLHHGIPFFQNFSPVKAHHLQTKRDHVPITTSVFQGVIASQVL